ncbi:calcium-binding protein [Hansschlegelia zhihuaiae]|nr:calcium-binding protein [Hansschlegelia zhihuaiae]
MPKIGAATQVAHPNHIVGQQVNATVAANANGGFAIAYTDVSQNNYEMTTFKADGSLLQTMNFAFTHFQSSDDEDFGATSSIDNRIELVGREDGGITAAFLDTAHGGVVEQTYWAHSPVGGELGVYYGAGAGSPFLSLASTGNVILGHGLQGGDVKVHWMQPNSDEHPEPHDIYNSPAAENRVEVEGVYDPKDSTYAVDQDDVVLVYRNAATGAVHIESTSGNTVVGFGSDPHIAALAGGGFAVTWDVGGGQVLARIFEADGKTPRGAAVAVDNAGASQSHVCSLDDGRFLVTWRDYDASGVAPKSSIMGHIYNADGSSNSGPFTIETATGYGVTMGAPRADQLVDGRIVVTYHDGVSAATTDVKYRILDAREEGLFLAGGKLDDDFVGTDFADIVATGKGADKVAAGAAADALSGGAGKDKLYGEAGTDRLFGDAGKDTLDGGLGIDTTTGGFGDDWHYVDNAKDVVVEKAFQGAADRVLTSVDYALAADAQVEILSTADDAGVTPLKLTGNDFANTIIGNAGANALEGKGGSDTLQGGNGDDVYIVESAGDQVVEAFGQGIDTVKSGVTYTLSDNVENLQLTGSLDIGGVGNAGANTLTGNAGANTLNGKGDADLMIGGKGGDTYVVDHASDKTVESAGEGNDTVVATVDYALGAGQSIEKLVIASQGSVTPLKLTGNELGQTIEGNAGANVLNGGGGIDVLQGFGGKDVFAFTTTLGAGNIDKVTDFSTLDDLIGLDSAIFSKVGPDGALAASAFAVGATAADASDRIIYNSGTGALLYDQDGAGGAAAQQFAVISVGLTTLTSADFLVL